MKILSAEGAFGETTRKGPRSTNRYVEIPSAEAFLNFTAKEVICRGKAACCAIRVEREQKRRSIVLRNNSPRSYFSKNVCGKAN